MQDKIFKEYLDLLKKAVSFRSVSTDGVFKGEVEKCFNWYSDLFKRNGFKVKTLQNKNLNNILFAEYNVGAKETCLIYGHYDVQPADIKDGWQEDPFKLVFKNNRLIARGVVDNKGQNLIHIVSILNLIKQNKLKYNVKFLLEGDEETGSEGLDKIIKTNKQLLASDFVLISDGEVFKNNPCIEVGFRGTFNATLTIKTADNDLHSGIYGGFAKNAILELCRILCKMYRKDGKVAIKNFYKDVDRIPKNIKDEFQIKTGLLPCIEFTGIQGGYTKQGYKNAIPATAFAKVNFRLVEKQSPQKVAKYFVDFIKQNISKEVKYKVKIEGLNKPLKINVNNKYVERAREVLESVWKKKVVFKYVGGSLPITNYFHDILKTPLVMAPLANEDCNMHGVNENFNIDFIRKGIDFSLKFLGR
ncbi:putative succinyl-diaminopimelate desuccinylase [bacterium HR34]|nr:putative succinyl-diaminopimelate desuccinylase [bacterium HR34]